jgi:N6-adenosine-specific RNA methylase IME4
VTILTETTYQSHRLAELIPLMSDEQYEALRADVAKQGLLEPIVLYENQVLDGRHRYRACIATGTEPRFQQYGGDDPVAFVISLNVHRRHLTATQKGFIANDAVAAFEEDAKRHQGTRTDLQFNIPELVPESKAGERESRTKAAEAVGVNPHYVSDAKFVEREAPELVDACRDGSMNMKAAKREIRLQQKAVLVAAISALDPAPLDSIGPFPVIYADPPWRYDAGTTDQSRVIENNYPTMSLDEIKALEIPAAEDAVLYLWATSPMLVKALDVMEAWGFEYRTCAVWVKDRIGMGYYFRQQHELLLVGKRGALPVPDPEDRVSSVFHYDRGPHSAKPTEVREVIEHLYPTLEKVELFSRSPHDGWASWGQQAES